MGHEGNNNRVIIAADKDRQPARKDRKILRIYAAYEQTKGRGALHLDGSIKRQIDAKRAESCRKSKVSKYKKYN